MQNKTQKVKNGLLYYAMIIFAALWYSSCPQHVSLGASVDVLPPQGEIYYPDAGDTPIRGSFVMKGTANDDEGVKAVSVVFQNIETKERIGNFYAELTADSATSASWTIRINNECTGTEADHPLVNVYPIPDGKYTAIVTVTDSNGKTSRITKDYTIDNTAPVFIVQRPSTFVAEGTAAGSADPYGAVFFVVGQAEDKNTIEDLTLKVKDSNVSISKKFVGKNINEEMAAASVDTNDVFTDPLYLYNDQNGSPKIEAHVFLTDNARIFSGTGEQGNGNTSKWYYLRDKDFRDEVLGKGYTADVINDYFAGKKGSKLSLKKNERLLASLYDAQDVQGQKVKEILENSRIIIQDEQNSEKYSVFTLNPNKSPGFQITGVTNLPEKLPGSTAVADLPAHTLQFFAANTLPVLIADLVCNADKDELVERLDFQAYRESGIALNLYKCDPVSYTDSGSQKVLQVNKADTPAYSLKFADLTVQDETDQVVSGSLEKLTVRWALPAGLVEGYYVIRVEGQDSKGNDFVAHNGKGLPGGLFVVQFEKAGDRPFIVPRAPSGYIREDFHVIVNVSSLGSGAKVCYKIGAPASESDQELSLSGTTEYKTLSHVSLAGVGTDGKHTVHFMAKDNDNPTPVRAQMDFYKDTTAPVVTLSYPDPQSPQAGIITVRGEVSDELSGVKTESTKYIIGKKTPEPTADSTEWQDMNKSSLVWEFTYNLDSLTPATDGTLVSGSIYDIPLYILAEDKVGNKAVSKKTIRFDSDGTKPIVKVLSPLQNQILGGVIQIFGTASVRAGNPSDIEDVSIQIAARNSSAIPDFNTGTGGLFTFGTKDYYNGGNGQTLTGMGGTGGASWQVSVNENGEFNNPSADPNGQNWDVYFRLRAKNKNTVPPKWGEWSEPVKITVDKAYPTIGSPASLKVANSDDSGVPENYTPGMWIAAGKKLTGSLFDEAGIKSLTISSPELLGSQQTYSLQQALSHGWIAEDTAHAPTLSSNGAKNYTLQIPLNIDSLSEPLKRKGELSVKIKIIENTPKELYSEQTLNFCFDITPPAGDVGELLHRYTGNVSATSLNDSMLAQKIREHVSGADYSKLGLLIGNTVVTISGVSGNVVSFTPSLALAGWYDCLLYKKPFIIYNGVGGKWIVRGVANDNYSGVTKIKTWVKVNTTQTPPVTLEGSKITKLLGRQVSWEGEIDLSSLPDGKGELHCEIIDDRGNMYTVPPFPVSVKNKPIKLETLTLSTDIGGSPIHFENDTHNNALVLSADENRDYVGTFTSKNFAFKNKDNSKIKIKFTGGEGQIKYRLKKGTAVLTGTDLKDITRNSSNEAEIDLKDYIGTGTDKIGNSEGTPTEIALELWDSAHGFSAGEDSASAKIGITTLFDALDTQKPTVVILPFRWNGENDNSLYQSKRENGHVEIGAITALGNDHSSVSGKVTIRGFAYDNIQLKTLTATLPNASNVSITNTNNSWSSYSDSTSNIRFEVEKSDYDYLGYYVKWKLDWDTEKTSVGLEKDIKVVAGDGTNNSLDSLSDASSEVSGVNRQSKDKAEHADFANAKPGQFISFKNGEALYVTRVESVTGNQLKLKDDVPTEFTAAVLYKYKTNSPAIKVNVVPYITGIETFVSNNAGKEFARSAKGDYPVREGETVKLYGFNFGSTANVAIGTQPSVAVNLTSGYYPVNVGTSVKSGILDVSVDGIKAINNINKKPVFNTAGIPTTAAYNVQSHIANKYLTDDLALSVWEIGDFNSSVVKDITSPMLKVDSASNWYMSYGEGVPAMIVNKNGTKTQIDRSYNKFHNTAVAFDANQNIYALATNTDRIDDNSAKFSFYSRAQLKNSNNHDYQNSWTGKSRLEKVFNGTIYNINRVKRPKMVVSGGTASAKVYMAYFDSNDSVNPVKFRYGTVDSSNGFSNGLLDESYTNGYHTVADKNSTYKGGEYAAVGVTSGGVAVVAWYDASAKQLVYSWNDTPQTIEPSGGTNKWQTNAQVIDSGYAGWYVDLAVDENDGIHIAYYNSAKGDLKYAYLSNYNKQSKAVTVDSYLSVGTQIMITTRKDGVNNVPYISYYHASFTQTPSSVRVAWRTDFDSLKDGAKDDSFTGAWEAMTIPTENIAKDETICNGAPKTGTWANTMVVGFMTDAGYKKAVLKK